MKILLLEDDIILHESIQEYLEFEGWLVANAYSSTDVYELTFKNSFDLYLFDVNVLGDNGFDILKALRDSGDKTPTIFITALADIESLRKGFSVGADDYIKKPFNPEELMVRIRSRYTKETFIFYQDLKYEVRSRKLSKNSQPILLSRTLSNLFHLLITHKNSIVSLDNLFDALVHPNPNALRVNMSKLKSRLCLDIRNIKGMGYMLKD